MTRRRGTSDPSGAMAFSPVDNDAPLRWWRRLRIVPAGELGAGRRAVLAALVAWLPIAVWALATGRFASADTGEPLFQHYGIHVRYLVAIPLFILGEAALHRAGMAMARQFVASGAVTPDLVPRFEATNRSMVRLRDASLPWAFALAVAIAWSLADTPAPLDDAMSWAFRADGSLGFGGWWAAYVARPIFVALLSLRFLPHEPLGPSRVLGLVVGISGVALITGFHPDGGWWAVAGTLAIVLSSLSYASGGIFGQLQVHGTPGPVLAAGSMLVAAAVLVPFALAEPPTVAPGASAVVGLLLLILLPTVIGQLMLFRILRLHGSRRLSLVTYLMPGFAIVYGALILGESVTVAALGGLALILLGIALASGQRLFGWGPQERPA